MRQQTAVLLGASSSDSSDHASRDRFDQLGVDYLFFRAATIPFDRDDFTRAGAGQVTVI